MKERIDFTVDNHIAHIRLVRGDKMNALDGKMMNALIEASEMLKSDPSIRVAVMSGDGRAFCAGLDSANFAAMAGGDDADVSEKRGQKLTERTYGLANRVQQVAFAWRQAEVPVIAAAHGFALGGGFQIFMGADIRYAAPGTKFSIMEARWGLVPDMGTTHVMTRVAGEDIVKELALTARIFDADAAKEYGFITRLYDDPLAAAMVLAHEIAGRNPDAVRGTKRLFNEPADRFVADTLLLESAIQDTIIGTPNQREAVRAELEKRTPDFDDPKVTKQAAE